jgi:hypothetical protein
MKLQLKNQNLSSKSLIILYYFQLPVIGFILVFASVIFYQKFFIIFLMKLTKLIFLKVFNLGKNLI